MTALHHEEPGPEGRKREKKVKRVRTGDRTRGGKRRQGGENGLERGKMETDGDKRWQAGETKK